MSESFAGKFKARAAQVTKDLVHRATIRTAMASYEKARDEKKALFQDWQAARDGAAAIKWEAINHLDDYLSRFAERMAARGTKVFWAANGQEARDYIVALAKEKGARSIIKSKTMTSEEIHLNEALRQAGYEVVESDLGEFIVQLREEAPYHLVFPAMHLTRGQISDLFQKKLHSAPSDNPEDHPAQTALEKCSVGITACDALVAQTGSILLTARSAGGRALSVLPPHHLVVAQMNQLVADLPAALELLSARYDGNFPSFATFITGPSRTGDIERILVLGAHGPRLLTVILVQ